MRVVVNAAMSADGKLSSRRREQIAISGPEDFERVDDVRADSDAIMVGVGTVLADDPHLTVDGSSNPARVVADSRARTPPDARIVDDAAETYVLVTDAAPDDRIQALEDSGVVVLTAGTERVDVAAALDALAVEGVETLMVEGGGELIFSLFEAGLVDELRVFVGPKIIGGREAPTLVDGDGFTEEFPQLSLESVDRMDDGVLLRWV